MPLFDGIPIPNFVSARLDTAIKGLMAYQAYLASTNTPDAPAPTIQSGSFKCIEGKTLPNLNEPISLADAHKFGVVTQSVNTVMGPDPNVVTYYLVMACGSYPPTVASYPYPATAIPDVAGLDVACAIDVLNAMNTQLRTSGPGCNLTLTPEEEAPSDPIDDRSIATSRVQFTTPGARTPIPNNGSPLAVKIVYNPSRRRSAPLA